jgi:hypothetical protein
MSFSSTCAIEAASGTRWFATTPIPAEPGQRPLPRVRFDLRLRSVGLLAIGSAVGAVNRLLELVHIGVHHPATPLEYACAAVAFIGASCGGAMLVHGSRLFDDLGKIGTE